VLYEMLTGRSAFKGDTVSDTLASVLKLDPDFDALPPAVPRRIRRLVTRCLQKDRKQRLHHIADARILLEESLAGLPDEPAPDLVALAKRRTTERLVWLAAAVVVGIVAAATAWNLRLAEAERPHRKILLALDGEDPDDPGLSSHRVSPDGERIVYRNGKKVFVRDLDAWSSREIPAAEGAVQIFWSYDGASFGFVRDKKLWRISVDGSDIAVVCELPKPINGATWSPDGTIIMAGEHWDSPGLYSVSERGGDPEVLILSEEGAHFHDPHVLPNGRGVLVTVHTGDEMRLALAADGEVETFFGLETRFMLRQVYSSGHVLYLRGEGNRGIWAVPFSLETLQVTGDPFLVAPDGGQPSVSRDGTLLYGDFSDSRIRRLVWVDRQGEILGEIGQSQEGFDFPTLSPDGGKIAVSAAESTTKTDIWIVDVTRGAQNRLTFEEGMEFDPVWTPDGRQVIYRHRIDDERSEIRITKADGSGEPETLVDGFYFSLSPDGKHLIFTRDGEGTGRDLWFLELGVEGEAEAIVTTPSDEREGRVSPDGEYLAYSSDETGQDEIFLKRFPSGEGKWQASVDGGTDPRWSPLGDELFWADGGDLMVVEVETRPELKLGTPRVLFSWSPSWALSGQEFDVAADGQRFVLVTPEDEDESPNQVKLVENWSQE
jgi:serine/threonine-protein kinase